MSRAVARIDRDRLSAQGQSLLVAGAREQMILRERAQEIVVGIERFGRLRLARCISAALSAGSIAPTTLAVIRS